MKRVMVLSVLVLWGFFSGCMKFSIHGSYYYKDVLTGSADYNLLSGTSHLQIEGRLRKVRCEGNSHGTHAPLVTVTGAGYGGEGELRCSDGRLFKVEWASVSWLTGYGVGHDRHGDRMTFVYGMDESEAEKFLLKELPAILERSK